MWGTIMKRLTCSFATPESHDTLDLHLKFVERLVYNVLCFYCNIYPLKNQMSLELNKFHDSWALEKL